MMDQQYAQLANLNHLEVNLVGVANSKKMLFKEEGIQLSSAIDNLINEGEVMSLPAYAETMTKLNLSHIKT